MKRFTSIVLVLCFLPLYIEILYADEVTVKDIINKLQENTDKIEDFKANMISNIGNNNSNGSQESIYTIKKKFCLYQCLVVVAKKNSETMGLT